MAGLTLPPPITALANELLSSAGVQAVVVGGSRATGDADGRSDWDLGVYYRDHVDLTALERRGEVHPPGRWGRLMTGGAWLDVEGARVDVLLRDLDAVEHWAAEANAGRYEVDGLLGYVAGLPTYSLSAEASVGRLVGGVLDLDTTFPDALAAAAPPRWRYHRDFSLQHAGRACGASQRGRRGRAARPFRARGGSRGRAEQRRWALNEKRLLDGTGLDDAAALLADLAPDRLTDTVDAVGAALAGRSRSG